MIVNLPYHQKRIQKILREDKEDYPYVELLRSKISFEMNKVQLTALLGFDKSFVSRVLHGQTRPSPEMKKRIKEIWG